MHEQNINHTNLNVTLKLGGIRKRKKRRSGISVHRWTCASQPKQKTPFNNIARLVSKQQCHTFHSFNCDFKLVTEMFGFYLFKTVASNKQTGICPLHWYLWVPGRCLSVCQKRNLNYPVKRFCSTSSLSSRLLTTWPQLSVLAFFGSIVSMLIYYLCTLSYLRICFNLSVS